MNSNSLAESNNKNTREHRGGLWVVHYFSSRSQVDL